MYLRFRKFTFMLALGVSAIGVAMAGCASLPSGGSSEHLDWNPEGFKVAFAEKTGWKGVGGRETYFRILAKQGENSTNWTEKLEITELPIAITLGSSMRWNPVSVMEHQKANVEEKGCTTVGWRILKQEETTLLYEWTGIDCPGYLHQDELTRIVMGRWFMWTLSYGVKAPGWSKEVYSERVDSLRAARVAQ